MSASAFSGITGRAQAARLVGGSVFVALVDWLINLRRPQPK